MSLAEIKPRNIKFALAGEDKRNWFAGNPVATAIMDGASILFPLGETFFIQSVVHFRDRIADPQLQAEITGFQQQEGIHSREHRRYNKAVEAFGGNIAELEGRLQAEIDELERRNASPEYKLALTCAFEHFTAMLADDLLAHPDFMAGADPEFSRIWHWHAIEEAEHKSVAYDVWNVVGPKGLKGYWMRARAMMKATSVFVGQSRYNARALLRARGYGGFRTTVLGVLYFSLIKPGVLRRSLPAYLAYFKPGFHPWQHDNRHLIEKFKSAYEA
ncbi:metal-dependent hydrolase [Zavarzinia compransoris]|uniref:metal-dependent hydrolase n=1 Tax=Zavarzinia marina TaxID=2911065 RepID=UPI001F2440C5|nr:metal-dependent hydrolase [Zavarzinia marina]MCF4166698.1 metal-dependent hydrolase [Zavarzinia marina]